MPSPAKDFQTTFVVLKRPREARRKNDSMLAAGPCGIAPSKGDGPQFGFEVGRGFVCRVFTAPLFMFRGKSLVKK